MKYKCNTNVATLMSVLTTFLSISDAGKAPFINKCKAEDSECIKKSAQIAVPIVAVGIPGLGVDSMDPLSIDKIDASSPTLQLLLNDISITGLKNCIIEKARRDLVKSNIFLEVLCLLELNGQYKMSGHLLSTPLEGHGKVNIVLRNANFTGDGDIEYIQKADGKIYWHITDWKHTFELLDKASIVFENLFNGNETLARRAQEAIDENVNQLLWQIGKPISDTLVDTSVVIINQFYNAVPSEDLALD